MDYHLLFAGEGEARSQSATKMLDLLGFPCVERKGWGKGSRVTLGAASAGSSSIISVSLHVESALVWPPSLLIGRNRHNRGIEAWRRDRVVLMPYRNSYHSPALQITVMYLGGTSHQSSPQFFCLVFL